MGFTCVAFDLETTGLSPEADVIIEIGAVGLDEEGRRETFRTLVNPGRPLTPTVAALTGISDDDLRRAPPLEAVAGDFERFISGAVLVGQNIINFDTIFLDRAGIRRSDLLYDTAYLSAILLPALQDHGLAALAAHFGIDFPVRHRALADAEAAMAVFLALRERAVGLPQDVLAQIAQWMAPTAWPYRRFFAEAWEEAAQRAAVTAPRLRAPETPGPLSPAPAPRPVPPAHALSVLDRARDRPDVFAEFDRRAEQRAMVEAVCEALNGDRQLIIEAGTGTGKSLAYLIPAACYALENERRVVVSTATINLQEQLTRKDIPALQALLASQEPATGEGQRAPSARALRACQLKGRRNYLCLRRFEALRATPSLSDEEAQLASRVLVWLLETQSGDRAELRLGPQEEAVWLRISAEGADCTSANSPFVVDGTCFLQRARRQAEGSHLVVVNHSLLLSDIAAGARVLPPYEHLVIDEAHHLEDEASRQFGFRCSERDMLELLEGCRSLAPDLQKSLRAVPLIPESGRELLESARALGQLAAGAGARLREFAERARAFVREHAAPGEQERGADFGQDSRLHVNRAMRVQPGWAEVEIGWENLKLTLAQLIPPLQALLQALSAQDAAQVLNAELIAARAGSLCDGLQAAIAGMQRAIEEDDPQRVAWFECDRSAVADRRQAGAGLTVAWVPLAVDNLLRETLYADRQSVVLTGATLRTPAPPAEGPAGAGRRRSGFEYIQERLGLHEADTVALGSPFDYKQAALVLIPRDMPEPASPAYHDYLARAVIDLARASQGRALVLFTSYASLQATHRAVAPALAEEGIAALAQGTDGSPRQLVRALMTRPRTLLLGTASFWEGVDIPGEALSLLIMARLPFAVPTEPVFAARSALYDDPFGQYALPQAVLRFKQGFGRLIRTRTDRGVLTVLDQRIGSKQYGWDFLNGLPPCTRQVVTLREMPALVEQWLARG